MKLLTSCQLYNYRPRKDGSLSLTFITGEKSPSDVMQIHTMLDVFGYMIFKGEDQLTKDEIDEVDNLDTELYGKPKSKSKRQMDILFRNWELVDNKGFKEWKDYYSNEMDIIAQHYLNKLPERE